MKHSPRITSPNGALVIGGDYRGLGVVRSLGRKGIPVWVLCDTHSVAAYSRYTAHSMPWPELEAAGQVACLIEIAQQHGLKGWTLFPTGDETTALIARHQKELAVYYRLTTMPWDVIGQLIDKRQLYQLAAEIGVPHPQTFYLRTREDLIGLNCRFPVILKPAQRMGFNPFVHEKAWKVSNTDELLTRFEEACHYVAPELVMVQEWIPGGGTEQYSYAALYQDGLPIAELSARRTRQFPQDFGRFSTFVESIELSELEMHSRRLLAVLNFTGLVELEFKRDPRSGQYKLIDANPRVWGWHTLGRQAGLDFSYLQWQIMNNQPVSSRRGQAGLKWVRLLSDLLVASKGIRAGQVTLKSYIASLSGVKEFAVFALDDPLPGLIELPLMLKLALKRGKL